MLNFIFLLETVLYDMMFWNHFQESINIFSNFLLCTFFLNIPTTLQKKYLTLILNPLYIKLLFGYRSTTLPLDLEVSIIIWMVKPFTIMSDQDIQEMKCPYVIIKLETSIPNPECSHPSLIASLLLLWFYLVGFFMAVMF